VWTCRCRVGQVRGDSDSVLAAKKDQHVDLPFRSRRKVIQSSITNDADPGTQKSPGTQGAAPASVAQEPA